MAAYTPIDDSSAYFQAETYTGGGANSTVTFSGNSDLQPDLLWIKRRNAGYGHNLFDTNRGIAKLLEPDNNNTEKLKNDHKVYFESIYQSQSGNLKNSLKNINFLRNGELISFKNGKIDTTINNFFTYSTEEKNCEFHLENCLNSFDKALSYIEEDKIIKIGLGFSFQKVDKLPINQYDKKLDYIITEKKII